MELERRAYVDLFSRILSIVSLLVAIAAVGYVYMQHTATDDSADLLTAFSNRLANEAQVFADARGAVENEYKTALDRQDARLEQWNVQLNDSLQAFRADADVLLARIEKNESAAADQRQLTFQQALSRFNQVAESGVSSEIPQMNGPQNERDPADAQPELPAEDEQPSASQFASLRVANTVLSPGTGNTTLIVIENNGAQDAAIERIRFRPQGEFETTESFDLSAPETPSSVTTIAFRADDNTSNKPGYHGIYDHQLAQALTVPAGERRTIRVTIDDPQYEGWGFTGKLILEYNASDPLIVDTARVAFHSES